MNDGAIGTLGRPVEILLVEDNYGDVLLTKEAFRTAKIANQISVAGDGEEALSMLRQQGKHAGQTAPDVILLDLNLPRVDGREVLEQIKGDATLHKIPVVVLTSSNAHSDIVKSYDLNANSYIVKPVNFASLQKIVASIEDFWFTVVVLPSQPENPNA